MTSTVLSVRGLTAGYGDLTAIRDVSFDVEAGGVTVLLGRNGAGKTTTLHAVIGLIKAAAGEVNLAGRDLSGRPVTTRVRLGVGLVQENKRIFRRRTVRQNLLIGAYTLPKAERRTRVEEALDMFPILREKSALPAGALSGGQQQMLAIAQALMPRPRVLLLDEPSAGLAPSIVNEVLETVVGLKATGIGILLVEQLIGKALAVADQVVVIDQGRVVAAGTPQDVTEQRIHEVYLGAAG